MDTCCCSPTLWEDWGRRITKIWGQPQLKGEILAKNNEIKCCRRLGSGGSLVSGPLLRGKECSRGGLQLTDSLAKDLQDFRILFSCGNIWLQVCYFGNHAPSSAYSPLSLVGWGWHHWRKAERGEALGWGAKTEDDATGQEVHWVANVCKPHLGTSGW